MFTSKLKGVVMTGLVVAAMFACVNEQALQPVSSNSNARTGADDTDFTIMRGHYILMASNNQLPASLADDVAKAKGHIGTVMAKVGVATATSDDPDFAAKASRIPGIQAVMADVSVQWVKPGEEVDGESVDEQGINPPTSTNLNPRFNLQWGHDAIDSPEAWQAGFKGEGARVAVLDGGFDLDHPDIEGNIVYSKSFVPNQIAQYVLPNPFSHGTHTAGTVAALDNGIGVIGVAPSAKLLLIKVLRDSGSGAFSWMLEGILEAVEQDADIISMSLGGYVPRNGKFLNNNGTPNDPSDDFVVNDTKEIQDLITVITHVINYAHRQGVTVIAAAGNSAIDGNHNQSGITLPGNLPNVICVSATGPLGWASNPATNLDLFAGYSNYGTPDITLAGPGGNGNGSVTGNCSVAGVSNVCRAFDLVFSTGNNGYYWSGGTSMATPHVAGVAALIVGKNGGQMDPVRVEAALKASADDLGAPGRDPLYGHGRVNAYKAVTNGL